MRTMLALCFCFAWSLLVASGYGQSMSPVITECGRKCADEFTVTNNGLKPLKTVVTAYSFDQKQGSRAMRPLDPTVHVRLTDMATTIPIRGSHIFAYKIACDNYPCLVNFFADLTVGHTDSGLAIIIRLPHVVYQCESAKNCRDGVRKAAGL
jgi:hypothetical protein